MTDHSPEFLSQYHAAYGRWGNGSPPDYARCAKSVLAGDFGRRHQCTRKNGHGPHGAWCKQHDPDAVKAKKAEREDKWRAEYDAKSRDATFTREAREAVRLIADGHNDPRGLCLEILRKMEGEKQ